MDEVNNEAHTSKPEDDQPGEKVSLDEIKTILLSDVSKSRKQSADKDETIKRLQKIVYDYEKGFVSSIKEPLIRDLILFRDSFEKFKSRFEEASSVITKEIDFLNDEIEDIFFSHGVELIEVQEEYDRTTQIVRKKVPTDDPYFDRKVLSVLKSGYKTDKKILRKQEISLSIYTAQNPANEQE